MALSHILQFLALTMYHMMSLKKPFLRKVTQKLNVCTKVSVLKKKSHVLSSLVMVYHVKLSLCFNRMTV